MVQKNVIKICYLKFISNTLFLLLKYLKIIYYISFFSFSFQKCVDRAVSDKSIFSTFARTLPPSSKVSKSIVALLKHFDWNRLMLLVSDKHSHRQTADALIHLAVLYDIDIVETFNVPGDYLTKDNKTLKDIVLKTYKRTRSKFHLCNFFFFSSHHLICMYIYRYKYRMLQNSIDPIKGAIEDIKKMKLRKIFFAWICIYSTMVRY